MTARKRAEEAEAAARTEREELLMKLAGIALMLGTARDLDTVYRTLASFLISSVPCNGLFVSRYDAETALRTCAYAWTEGEEIDAAGLPALPFTGSPVSRAIEAGEIVVTDDFDAAVEGKPRIDLGLHVDARRPRSSLAAPMLVMGRVLGAIEVQSVEPGAYSRANATVVQVAANLAAMAIDNVRLLAREIDREEHLRHAQRMEAIGRLAGGVAHDFNNIVTVVSGYSDILLRRLGPHDPLRQDVHEIKDASTRAATLTRQLLAFSRKQIFETRVLNLNRAIERVERMLGRLIGEDVELVTSLDATVGRIRADPGQIEQVIVNLVVNARDAMPDGGRLVIATNDIDVDESTHSDRAELPPGNYVRLAFTDTGTGMDVETLNRIFEPFFTTKAQGRGTGLGLATVYGIVNQSDGFILVSSAIGRGTTFEIFLPRVDDEATGEFELPKPQVLLPRGTETILLVEDESSLRKLAAKALIDQGYDVLSAANGGEALLVSEQFDGDIELLVTDIVMPYMNGRQLAERLERERPGLRVLFMSGYNEDEIVNRGIRDSRLAFLAKPFSTADLAKKIRDVLDQPTRANMTTD